MKILHLTKYYPPDTGGIETFVQGLAGEQVRQGHEVVVLSHQAQAGLRTTVDELEGVRVVRARTLINVAFAPLSPAFLGQLRRLSSTFQPDILHVHLPNVSAFLALPLSRAIPLLVHWHADVITRRHLSLRLLYPGYALFEKRLLSRAARVCVTSQEYLDSSRPLQTFRDKCEVIPLGLDMERILPVDRGVAGSLRREYRSRPLVVAVGRFSYYKGFEHLIRAAALLPDISLVIIGQGPLHEACSRLATELGVQDRVSLPGALSEKDLWQHYHACDVVCLPSVERTEAFGMVLLEAMACGKPLVTTRVWGSGMNMVNVHEQTGLQVLPEDPRALAGAVKRLIQDPQRARTMGHAGRQRLEQHFTMQRVAQRIAELYASI